MPSSPPHHSHRALRSRPPLAPLGRYRSPRWQDFSDGDYSNATLLNHTIKFGIPEGLGARRQIFVIVRPSSSSMSSTAGTGPGDLVSNAVEFSYKDPLLSFVELRALDDAVLEQLSAPPPPNFVVLTAHGSNFGPSRSLLSDVVVRQLLLRPTTSSGAPLPGTNFSTAGSIDVRYCCATYCV
jgi:hypothetical protein